MSTEKKRKKYAFSDETIEKLDWLVKEHQKEVKNVFILVIHFLN